MRQAHTLIACESANYYTHFWSSDLAMCKKSFVNLYHLTAILPLGTTDRYIKYIKTLYSIIYNNDGLKSAYGVQILG